MTCAVSENGDLGKMLVDVGSLRYSPTPAKKSEEHRSAKHGSSSRTKQNHTKEKTKLRQIEDVFSSVGLMTVDDLLRSTESYKSAASSSYDRDQPITTASEASIKTAAGTEKDSVLTESIHTYRGESIATQSVASEVRTGSPSQKHDDDYYASDFDETLKDTESIRTEESASSRRRSHR